MQLTLQAPDARLVSDVLEVLKGAATSPDRNALLSDLQKPFQAMPVVVNDMQVFQLQSLISALLGRAQTQNPGFNSKALELMEELLLELSFGERRQ